MAMAEEQRSGAEWTEALRKCASKYKAPGSSDSVWKEECAFSFKTPFDDAGLYLNLETYQAYSMNYVGLDHDRSGNVLYLKIKYTKVEKEPVEKEEKKEEGQPSKLAIGVEGGFDVGTGKRWETVKEYGLVIYPRLNDVLAFPPKDAGLDIPMSIAAAVEAIIKRDDAFKENQVQAWNAEDEVRPISKFAENLPQLDNGVKISPDPKTWECADSGLKENLWLNLSDGYIGSGRRNWDGTGGTGAALKHFEETGKKFPLCVKLGTITPEGKAEVYSYDPSEDMMVTDPYLEKHLAHFGLNMREMKKTDKTLIEMEVDLNMKHVFSAITEEGKTLVPVYGPGHVGMTNLGNSCYMNSSLQVLFSLDEFKQHYHLGSTQSSRKDRNEEFLKAPSEPESSVKVQLVKLGAALSDPEGSGVEKDEESSLTVSARMLKDSIGKGHQDFRGTEQQDAVEYLSYLFELLKNNDEEAPSDLFNFVMEERLQDMQSNQVKYKRTVTHALPLTIPMHKATNLPKVEESQRKKSKTEEETVLPSIPFQACLDASIGETDAAVQTIVDYVSPVTKQAGIATQTVLLASFPRYLIVQLRRYVVSEIDYTPKKLDCLVQMPMELDMSKYRSTGKKEHEVLLPEVQEESEYEKVMRVAEQLQQMGFDGNLCKHAAIQNKNAGVDQAMNWLLEHMEDMQYLTTPAEMPKPGQTGKAPPAEQKAARTIETNNGAGKYKLIAFISHIGKSTGSGHYVCHIYDESLGSWVIYNDRKVAKTDNPPLEHGYAYFYKRLD